jgi:hypothetical protein
LGDHSYEARPGHHLAPRQLSSGANVFEALGAGFTLLAFGAHEAEIDAFRTAAQALHAPLEIIVSQITDETAAYGHKLVLVRPDQFVAWAGERAGADAQAILAQAIGA